MSPGAQEERRTATRARIVRAALELVVERGYDGVSTADVLKRAGVSRGALYHHFDSRRALLAAVLETLEVELLERLAVAGAGESDPFAALQAGLQWYLDEAVHSRELARVGMLEGRRALGWDDWRATVSPHGLTVLARTLQACIDAGRIRAVDPDALAHLLLAALHEAGALIVSAEDRDAERRKAGEALAALVGGLSAGADTPGRRARGGGRPR